MRAYLADALVAASVEAAGAAPGTLNHRRSPMLAQVLVPASKPSGLQAAGAAGP